MSAIGGAVLRSVICMMLLQTSSNILFKILPDGSVLPTYLITILLDRYLEMTHSSVDKLLPTDSSTV